MLKFMDAYKKFIHDEAEYRHEVRDEKDVHDLRHGSRMRVQGVRRMVEIRLMMENHIPNNFNICENIECPTVWMTPKPTEQKYCDKCFATGRTTPGDFQEERWR